MFSKLFSIAIVAGSISSSLAAASCSRSYTVKAGDYCDKISREQKVSTFQLAAVNSPAINSDCTNLMPGQKLCLGTANEDCTDTYTVIPNDTCEDIASAGGFNSTILLLNNPQLTDKCDNLYVGEVLCVSKSVQVPPVPATGVVVPVSGPPAQINKPAAPVTTVLPDPTNTPAAPAAPAPTPVNNAPAPPASNGDDDDQCDDDDDDDNDSPANSPAPSNGDDDDDDDCDDDGDDTPASSVAPAAPSPTKAAASSSAPPAATSAAAGGDDDDDDDLPFCDELEL